MSVAFVFGNGISRRGMPLSDIKQHGTIYGCNAMYRDFTPDVLVATDKPIALQIESSGYQLTNKFYTRRPTAGQGALEIPKPYFGFSSGPVATALAANDNHRRIYMIGFDMGPVDNKKFNNLYAGTEFYKHPDSPPTYTGNWTKQIQQICKEFAGTKFIRVCGPTTARLPELDGIPNMAHLPLDEFIDRLNKLKDF
jgi:hypothetical protein